MSTRNSPFRAQMVGGPRLHSPSGYIDPTGEAFQCRAWEGIGSRRT